MEGPLVSVSMGVMKRLLAKLTNLLEEEYDKLKGVSKQIKFLRDELSAMTPALEMLGDAQPQELSPLTRYWRAELRELAYDMEDCVDNFMARVDHDGGEPTGFLWSLLHKFKKLITRCEIEDEIEGLKKRVMEVSERHKRYDFVELTSKSSSSSAVDPRLPALYEEIDRLVGIGKPKKDIIELLAMERNGSSAKLRVVSIVGCGGLGKTTLAKQVYDTVKTQFSCAAFVSVSQSFDVMKILKDIAKGVMLNKKTRDDDEKQLIDKLREHLKDKRYIVVLDDVWDTEVWKLIKPALTNTELGSRIVTTTRNTTIALSFSSQGGDVYQMKPLNFNHSKMLLFKRAFGSEDLSYTHLGSVPDELLRKCDGLPLAIITISSILTDQHAKCEWDRVLKSIGSALARNPGAGTMATILSLSYFDIPSHLRTCLLYLSMFPEDYVIKKQHLINRWIAEGFVHEEEGRTKYEIGEGYFNDLVNRSMIEPVGVKYGQAKACRVHDIILDYIKCKAAEENFAISLDASEHLCTTEYKVRRLSISNHMERNVAIWANPNLSQVRSVSIFGQAVNTSLLPSAAIRVLDLGDCWGMDDHHLESIEKLINLKYLHLSSRTNVSEKIGELRYLQILDIRGTDIKELPSTITKLQWLAHLYVDEDVRFPDGMIGEMHNLEEVSEYGIQSYEQRKSLQEFSKLTKLRTLNIKWRYNFDSPDSSERLRQAEGFHSYVGTLLSSCNLYNLYIRNFCLNSYPLLMDSWHPAVPCNLRKLCTKRCTIYKVPNWMASLGNLAVLKLHFLLCLRPQDVEILGAMPSLLFLKLETVGGTNGRIIVHGRNGFRSLKYFSLGFHYCGTALEFQVGAMPNLEHVNLTFHVHERECLNGASSLGLQHLSALSKVEIKIYSNSMKESNYDPTEDKNDGAVRCFASAINGSMGTHPNHPTVRFETSHGKCEHFECYLRKWNQDNGGVLTEWLKIYQIN